MRLALVNGVVYAGATRASALGCAGGRVAVAGDRAAVLGWLRKTPPTPEEEAEGAPPGVHEVDLRGATLLPGFVDAHCHLLLLALRDGGLDLGGLPTLERALEAAAAEARRLPPGAPLIGVGWDDTRWGRLPTRDDLDRVVPDRPALLLRKDGHLLWMNSAALAHYGLEGGAPGQPARGGWVDRDPATGRPTGLVRELLALEIFRDRLPPTPEPLALARLERAIRSASAAGVTAVTTFEGRETALLLQRRLAAGARDLRAAVGVPADSLEAAARLGLEAGFGDDWLRLGPVKLFLDGSLGSRTARLLEPYEPAGRAEPGCGAPSAGTPDGSDRGSREAEASRGGPPGDPGTPASPPRGAQLRGDPGSGRVPGAPGCGLTVTPDAEVRDLVRAALAAGFPLAMHAIGDAAVRSALDAFEAARAADPGAYARLAPRCRVEHVQLCHPADLPRFAALGVAASVQPVHAPADLELAERYWGRARSARAYPYASLVRAGARLLLGTDAPVEPIAPLRTLHAALTRQRPDGTPAGGWHPAERLDAPTAIEAYTAAAAAAAGFGRLGRLLPGWLADAVAVSVDPFRDPPEALADAEVRLVVVGGRIVHSPGW